MSGIGKPERATQNHVIALFRDELGYRHLGDWTDPDNGNIEEGLLTAYLRKCEYLIVHEMVHLLERTHNNHFLALMDQFMPQWRYYREMLNRLPVHHERWRY